MSPAAALISVVMPVYRVEGFIADAIESVLAQTDDGWELLLVDDGSDDASAEIAEQYRRRHPDRIGCLRHPGGENRGLSATRNLGRAHANGSYIAFLDADDVWIPTKLAEQRAILSAHPDVGLVVGASLYWHSWASGRSYEDEVVQVGCVHDVLYEPPALATTLYPIGRGAAPSMNTILVATDVFDAIGGFEEAFRTGFEDQAFLVKAYLTQRVYVSSACWDGYRQKRPGSITSTELHGEAKLRHKYLFYTWLAAHLERTGFGGTEAAAMTAEILSRPALERWRRPIVWWAKRALSPIRARLR